MTPSLIYLFVLVDLGWWVYGRCLHLLLTASFVSCDTSLAVLVPVLCGFRVDCTLASLEKLRKSRRYLSFSLWFLSEFVELYLSFWSDSHLPV